MLHRVTSSYHELARLVPGLVGRPPSSVPKKQRLLEMARRGEPRPHQTKHPLGRALNSYTSRGSRSYDPQFAKRAMRLAPHWFVSKAQAAEQKKKALLAMAKRGGPRPSRDNPIGRVLSNYTSTKSHTHDPAFTRKIKRICPDWFASSSQTNKNLLIDMASKGQPKSDRKSKIFCALKNYTSKASSAYDAQFAKQIRRLAPQWFVTHYETASHKKQQLIDMARKKLPRPKRSTPLGSVLRNYSRKSSATHDPVFDKQIRRIAPHWFERCSTR
jgi:hypothetical protein